MPVGQAAWIYEKLHDWSHHSGNLEEVFPMDEMLDTIMLYWLSNSSVSSARVYWECERDSTAWPISIPVGVSWFPGDIAYAPREWAQRYYSDIVHWREVEKGGHFAAWEVPDLFCTRDKGVGKTYKITTNTQPYP
jgi:pimeloyl-ACP methyl ester carboxylesterase